jgi:phosphatidylglycerophosphatase A
MQHLDSQLYIVITLLTTILGIWFCGRAAAILKVHDHPGIVLDEVAGLMITMLAVPTGYLWLLAGFVLFRVFDILKPWPISWLDRSVSGGLGIMLDDVLAGLMALAVLHACAYYLV